MYMPSDVIEMKHKLEIRHKTMGAINSSIPR